MEEWITLGKTQLRVSYLRSVSEEEAVAALSSRSVHADRVKNAWKIANGKKNANRKKQSGERITAEVIEPKSSKPKLEDLRKQYPHIKARSVDAFLAKIEAEKK